MADTGEDWGIWNEEDEQWSPPDYDENAEFNYAFQAGGRNSDDTLADFSPKKGPIFTPGESFFRYEQNVRDWLIVAVCQHDQCAMNLLMQFSNKAKYLKDHIDRVRLSQGRENADDPKSTNQGVEYLLGFLRGHFVSDNINIFLNKFFLFTKVSKREGEDLEN